MANNRGTVTYGTTAPANTKTGDVWVTPFAASRLDDADALALMTTLGEPFLSMYINAAGSYVPKRALDRWNQKAKPAVSRLTTTINNSVTSMTVDFFEGFPQSGSFNIKMDSEEIMVTAGAGTVTWTIVRGCNGTTAASHTAGAIVYGDGMFRIVTVGDSTNESNQLVGGDGWPTRLARVLAGYLGVTNQSEQMGNGGFYGVWCNNDASLGSAAGNSLQVWTAVSGAWTRIVSGTANDRDPWRWVLTASGSGNIMKFVPPTQLGDVFAVDVYYVDSAAGTGLFCYDVNNAGAFTNAAGSGTSANVVKRVRVSSGTAITDFRIKASSSAGATTSPKIIGIDCWNQAPVFSGNGVRVYNLGKDSDFLSTVARSNASGDNYALIDNAGNDQGSINADLVILGPFTNDVGVGSWPVTAAATYLANLNSLVTRLKTRADVILLTMSEQSGRNTTDQAALRAQVKACAIAQGVAYLDMYDAQVAMGNTGYTATDADGYHSANTLHYNLQGNIEVTARLLRLLGIG